MNKWMLQPDSMKFQPLRCFKGNGEELHQIHQMIWRKTLIKYKFMMEKCLLHIWYWQNSSHRLTACLTHTHCADRGSPTDYQWKIYDDTWRTTLTRLHKTPAQIFHIKMYTAKICNTRVSATESSFHQICDWVTKLVILGASIRRYKDSWWYCTSVRLWSEEDSLAKVCDITMLCTPLCNCQWGRRLLNRRFFEVISKIEFQPK